MGVTIGRWTRGPGTEENISPKSAYPLNDFAPLKCRVVRAVRVRGRWAWIPGRARSVFFPNVRQIYKPQSTIRAEWSAYYWLRAPQQTRGRDQKEFRISHRRPIIATKTPSQHLYRHGHHCTEETHPGAEREIRELLER